MLLLLLACATDPKDTAADDTGGSIDSGDTADSADSGDSGDSGDTGETDSGDTDSGDSGDSGDTAVDPPEVLSVSSELSSRIVTVVRVSWTTDEPTTGHVRFGEDTSYRYTTNTTALGTEHEVLLLGMPAETEVHFEVVVEDEDGAEARSGGHTHTTGILPAELPELTVTGTVTSWDGEFLIVPLQGAAYAVAILDSQGRYVWYDLLAPGYNLMRTVFASDGQSILHCKAGPQNDLSIGLIERVSMDGETRLPVPFPYVDHDFVELPDGTFAGIVVTEDASFGNAADRIVEQAPDGTQTVIWNAWEDPTLLEHFNPALHNWTHANALDYDPVSDDYFISLKELGTIVRVDRATGASEWYLNGKANEFVFTDGSAPGDLQHQFQLLDGGILIFDNGLQSRGYSRAVELAMDESALTAEEVWSFRHTPDLGVYAKGDVERYADGNTRVVWSTAGEIQDVTPDGTVLWQLNTELGYATTFVTRVPNLYGLD